MSKCRKITYRKLPDANRVATKMLKHGGAVVRAYRCRYCKKWHLTSWVRGDGAAIPEEYHD